jgi:hypothetical protein
VRKNGPDLLAYLLGFTKGIRCLQDIPASLLSVCQRDLVPITRAIHRRAAIAAPSAKCGFGAAKSRAARFRVFRSHGLADTNSSASSNRPRSFAIVNHVPPFPGDLSIRSRRIACGSIVGYFRNAISCCFPNKTQECPSDVCKFPAGIT